MMRSSALLLVACSGVLSGCVSAGYPYYGSPYPPGAQPVQISQQPGSPSTQTQVVQVAPPPVVYSYVSPPVILAPYYFPYWGGGCGWYRCR